MKKQDEIDLWDKVKDRPTYESIWWDDLLNELNIPIKRGYYILGKWCDKGIIEFGVSLRTAWLCNKENYHE